MKTRFHGYIDSGFSTELPVQADLGILGPVLRAEVGDQIVVELQNQATHPVSLYLQGVRVNKTQDGTWLPHGKNTNEP